MVNRKSMFLIIGVLLFLIWYTYIDYKGNESVNRHNCETETMAIKGIITGTEGRDSYVRIFVDNIKNAIWINPSKILSTKGFKEAYYFENGDSVIKEPNSKIITAKRRDSCIVFLLDCN